MSLSLDPNLFILRGLPGQPALPGENNEPQAGGVDVAQPDNAQPQPQAQATPQ